MIFLALSFLLYFAPALLATSRRNPNATAIWLTNLFVGWTIIGWIATLLWTLSTPEIPPRVVAYGAPFPGQLHPAAAASTPTPAWAGVYAPAESAATIADAPRSCVACNRPLPPDARFCPACGSVESRLD